MRTTLSAACALLALGCGSSSSDVIQATAKGTGKALITGEVSRTVAISKLGDGKGILHVGMANVCLSADGTAPTPIASAVQKDVDLSAANAVVDVEFKNLSDGTYYASAWFDDVVNTDQDEDLPGKGDLAMFTKATPVCVKVTIKDGKVDQIFDDGKVVESLKLVLNYEMPFNLTGTKGDKGVLMAGAGQGTVDPSTIDHNDKNTYEVSFTLTRSVDPSNGGDGKGIGVFALSDKCFQASGSPPPPLYSVEVKGVDLSAKGAKQVLTFKGVKNGIYQLNGYLDDVGEHTMARPLPSTGDMVRFGGYGPACVEIVVNGKSVTSAYDLNFVMTWDLNG